MKNPYSHVSLKAIPNLIKSVVFHLSGPVTKLSVSDDYLGLSAYVGYDTKYEIAKGSEIIFDNKGFLVLGTSRSSFQGWAGNNKIHMEEGARWLVKGYNEVGRGSLVWILSGGELILSGLSYTAGNNMLICKERIEIRENCSIAFGVVISDHDFHKTYTNGKENRETAPVLIKEGVWIGAHAKILKGVTIGEYAIVGAGAVVTRDVPARSMVAGNPAKVIKTNVEFYG